MTLPKTKVCSMTQCGVESSSSFFVCSITCMYMYVIFNTKPSCFLVNTLKKLGGAWSDLVNMRSGVTLCKYHLMRWLTCTSGDLCIWWHHYTALVHVERNNERHGLWNRPYYNSELNDLKTEKKKATTHVKGKLAVQWMTFSYITEDQLVWFASITAWCVDACTSDRHDGCS